MSFYFAGECAAKYHKKIYLSDFGLDWHMLHTAKPAPSIAQSFDTRHNRPRPT
jgi:hypothetical protein